MHASVRIVLWSALTLCALAVPILRDRHQFDRGPAWTTLGTGTSTLTTAERPLSIDDALETLTRQEATSNFQFRPSNLPADLELAPALDAAKAILDRNWPSNQEVLVNITFAKIGGKDVLANGGGTRFVKRTGLEDFWPVAAAEAVLGTPILEENVPEIEITMNTATNWHVGTEATVPASQYDFITVLLHEVYHQLIFSGRLTVRVASNTTTRSGVTQTLRFVGGNDPNNGGPARFDRFLANEDGCQVLDYQKADALGARLGVSTDQLAAFALTNDKTFFWSDGQAGSLAKMYSPPIWVPKTSAYHFDVSSATGNDAIMSSQISPGRAIRDVGPKIRSIQSRFLDNTIAGGKSCDPATLVDPTPAKLPTDSDRTPVAAHGAGVDGTGTGVGAGNAAAPDPPVVAPQSPRRIAGMRVWVFTLVMIFSILGALLLIGLCIFLVLTFLRARRKKGSEYGESSDVPTAEYQSDDVDGQEVYGEGAEQEGDEGQMLDDEHDGDADTADGGSGVGVGGAAAGAAAAGAAGAAAGAAAAGAGKDGADDAGEEGIDEGADGGAADGAADGAAGGAAGGNKNNKKKKKKNGVAGGVCETSDEYDSHEGADAYGRSVCPSSRKTRRHGASEVPHTFDPSSVPSPSSKLKRSGSSKRPKGCNDYYSSGSSSEYSGGGGQCGPKSSKSKSMSKSRSQKSMKPGSVCPPSTKPPSCGGYKNGVDGGDDAPFDCETPTELPYDCDTTIFDCNTISKAATAFAVSEKPIPRIANPSESSRSRYLYLDSDTTDSTHLRPYERGSSQKNPVAHAKAPKSPKSPRKRPTAAKVMPMSLAPSTMDKSEGGKVPSTKVPATNQMTRSSSKRSKRSKHSSKHVPSTYMSSSEHSASEYMEGTMDPSSKYDSTMGSELCKRGACKPMSMAPTSTIAPASTEPPTTTMQPMTTDFFDCTDAPPTKCQSKSSHSAKSSCKKSSSRKEIGKENECSNGKKSSSKHSSSKKSSCKRSQSSESIKSVPKCKLPSTKPPESCAPNSFYDESSHPSTAYESSKHPSSCPPSLEKEKPHSVCPTSEGKHATRYHGDSKRRRRNDDGHTTKMTTTKHYRAKYEDGRLVDKKSRTKETTKRYAATEDPTSTYFDYDSTTSPTEPSSMYTSSYFNTEDDKTTTIQPTKYSHRDDDKSSRRHRHHDDTERSHSRHRHRSRSRSEHTRSKSREHRRDDHHRRERSSRHGDEMRRSRSEKDVRYESRDKYRGSDELKRTKSKHGLKKSKSHHSISTKHYVTPVVPTVPVPATRRTDIHTVALDPELQSEYERSKRDKSERYETHESRSSRHRAKSSHRSHRRERSPSREGKERRERSPSRERKERRERSPSRERKERRERSHSRERTERRERSSSRERRERSPSRERKYEYDDGQMTVVKKKKKVTKVHVHVDRDRVHVEEY